jgi:hypothetical protein
MLLCPLDQNTKFSLCSKKQTGFHHGTCTIPLVPYRKSDHVCTQKELKAMKDISAKLLGKVRMDRRHNGLAIVLIHLIQPLIVYAD